MVVRSFGYLALQENMLVQSVWYRFPYRGMLLSIPEGLD